MAEKPGPLDYSRKLWLRAWLAGTFLFLHAPLVRRSEGHSHDR
jgi:hypothetical protein